MEKWIKEDFPATARVLMALMRDLMCVKCTTLEKDVYVLDCCLAKYCKHCASGRKGDVCAKCETKRQPKDYHKDLISSSVADLLIKFRGDFFEGNVNVSNFLGEAGVLLSNIQCLNEGATVKSMSDLMKPKVPSAAGGSEFVVCALTKVIPSAPKGGPEPALKAFTDMETADAASSLKTLTNKEPEVGSKVTDSAVELCRMNEKHETEEEISSPSSGTDAESVSMFGSTDKKSNGNDSDKEDSVKSAQKCPPSESYSIEDYSKDDEECFLTKPNSVNDPGSPLKITECVSDEELFEISPVCIPASPEILGPTPLKIAKAMPTSVAKAFQVKRLESLESGDMAPVNDKASTFIDPMTDLEIDFIDEGVYPPGDSGLQVDELEKLAEMQYAEKSSTESDETMEREEYQSNEAPVAANLVKPSRFKRKTTNFEVHRRFRTRSKVGKTIFGSQSPSTSDDLSIGVRTANLLKSVLSKKEEATLSDNVALPEESKRETFESDASVHGDIAMEEYGTTKSPLPVMAADPLGDNAGSDEDLFGEDVYEGSHAPQLTPYPPADNNNMATTEEVVKKKRKQNRDALKLKKNRTTCHGNKPAPLRKRLLKKRLREESISSALDEMPPTLTPQAAASSSAGSNTSSNKDANSGLEEILDLGTDEQRELREIEQHQKASKATDVDNSASFSTPAKEKRNAKGETPLHIACRNGNVQKVQELLESGAEIGATDHAGWIPLHDAISGKGTDVTKGAIVKLLCQRGCNVNALGGMEEDTPLHEASFYGLARIVEILLSFGAVPTIRNADGKLPRDVSDNDFIIKLLDKRAGDKRMSLNATTMAYLALEDPSLQQIRSQKAVFFFNFDLSNRVLVEVMTRLHLRVSDKLDNTVTHIVYETSTDNEDDRLVPFGWEYIFGLAKGLWQLSHHWIGKSLYHSRCLPLNDFEISGCGEPTDQAFKYLKYQTFAGTTGIPGLARVNREKGNPGLLDGFTFYLYKRCGVGKLNKKNIGFLAVNAGAQITNREPDPETIDPLEFPSRFHTLEDNNHKFTLTTHVILFTDHEAPPESKKYSMEHVKTLNLNWLVNTIGHFELVDPEDYL